MEANRDMVTRRDLRHDRHTVSLLTDHLVFSPKYSVSWIAKRLKGRSSKQTLLEKAFTEKRFAVRDKFPQLKEWCPGHLWAPSCYHKTFKKSFINKLLEKV